MSNEELVDFIQKGINTGEYMELLYRQNEGFIRKLVLKYGYKEEIEDLLQEAYFGLYEAVKRYENTAGVLFLSYATFWIRQAITRYLENNGRSVRLPAGLQAKMLQYKKFISVFEMKMGRQPSNYELSAHLRLKDDTLIAIRRACMFDSLQSLDEYIPGADEAVLADSIADATVDLENDVVNRMLENSRRSNLWKIVKDSLTPEENTVIVARYRNSMTVESVALLIGVPGERVKQLEANALRKLRRPRITRILMEKFEFNYARVYRGSLTAFKNTGTSIVEDIAIRNIEDMKENG